MTRGQIRRSASSATIAGTGAPAAIDIWANAPPDTATAAAPRIETSHFLVMEHSFRESAYAHGTAGAKLSLGSAEGLKRGLATGAQDARKPQEVPK